jgi:hypothetical protein
MATKSKAVLTAVLLAGIAARTQATSPQATISPTAPAGAPTASAAPCIPPPPQKCGFICREEQRLRIQAAIKSCQLTKGNVCDSPDIPTNSSKPCPVPVAPPPSPAPTTVPESKPIISDDGKHLYVCPRNSIKVSDLPVCQTADHSFVPLIEIPVPAGSLLKSGAANGASAGNASPAANNTTSSTPLTDAKPNPNAVTSTPTH